MPCSIFRILALAACLAAGGLTTLPASAQPWDPGGTMMVGYDDPISSRRDPRESAAPAPVPPAPAATPPTVPTYQPMPGAWVDGETGVIEPPPGWGFDVNEQYAAPYVVPWVRVNAELMWLHQTEANGGQALVVANRATGSSTVLSTAHLNNPVEPGIRASVIVGPTHPHYLELGFLGVFDQESRASIDVRPTGITSMTQNFFNGTLNSVTNFGYTAIYDSELTSPELNLWLDDDGWRFRPMIGARWFNQSETLQVYETATPANGGIASVSNDLIGGQVGFQTLLWQRTRWFGVQATCKAGLYHNSANLNASLNSGGATVGAFGRSFQSTAWSGEVNITSVWRFSDRLTFQAGYTGLWLAEVARVGDQYNDFDLTTGVGTADYGGLSYQGGHLGFTFDW